MPCRTVVVATTVQYLQFCSHVSITALASTIVYISVASGYRNACIHMMYHLLLLLSISLTIYPIISAIGTTTNLTACRPVKNKLVGWFATLRYCTVQYSAGTLYA